jgi:predicted nucleotidyltransferase
MRAVATEPEIEQALREFITVLQGRLNIERVVLYGSYANGRPHVWSDFDVAVVSPDFEGMPLWRRQEVIAGLSLGTDPRIAPIGFSSSEYHGPSPHSFLREIKRTGRVVYEARAAGRSTRK